MNVAYTLGRQKGRGADLFRCLSTTDKGQDVKNQLIELRAFCRRQGYEIYEATTFLR